MNSNLEYIRAFCGERGESDPLLSDEELKALLSVHVYHVLTAQLSRRLSVHGVDYSELDNAGLLRIKLKPLVNVTGTYYAGIGNWLDDAYTLEVEDVEYVPVPGDVVDTYSGRVIFATPPSQGAAVTVRTYLTDLRAVLIAVLKLVKASRARLSLRTNLSGVSVDLTSVCEQLQAEIEELSTDYANPIIPREDYPH